jgi:four helix bundle protein
MKIFGFEDSDIWNEARELSRLVFRLTSNGSFSKEFRFRDQIRASSGSVMDNIAEGFGRGGNKELINFLSIARGSNEETRSQAYRAFDYEYISKEELEDLLSKTETISKRITSLIQYLKQADFKGPKYK